MEAMLVVIMPIGGGTGGPHGPRPPLLFLGGLPPTFMFRILLK